MLKRLSSSKTALAGSAMIQRICTYTHTYLLLFPFDNINPHGQAVHREEGRGQLRQQPAALRQEDESGRHHSQRGPVGRSDN